MLGAGIGSGFLLPAACTAIYLPPAIAAARADGLGAVAGLTIVAGITSIVLSRVIQRIRGYLPAEVVGLVVTVLGIILGLLALRLVLGVDDIGNGGTRDVPAGLIALVVTFSVAVWGGQSSALSRSCLVWASAASSICSFSSAACYPIAPRPRCMWN